MCTHFSNNVLLHKRGNGVWWESNFGVLFTGSLFGGMSPALA